MTTPLHGSTEAYPNGCRCGLCRRAAVELLAAEAGITAGLAEFPAEIGTLVFSSASIPYTLDSVYTNNNVVYTNMSSPPITVAPKRQPPTYEYPPPRPLDLGEDDDNRT